MRQCRSEMTIATPGRGLHDVTARVRSWTEGQGIGLGLLTVFIHHTSASLVIQENADPDVLRDLGDAFARLVPEDPGLYRHGSEGPDDMPAHIKGALTQTHLAIPVVGGRLDLGTWQGIYLFEHRRRGRERRLTLHLVGE
jgi:secondary thiamine-phosphate synthase enzyme